MKIKRIDRSFIFIFVLSIIGLIIKFIVLDWLNKNQKCQCTDIPEAKYLKIWFTISIILSIISLFYLIFIGHDDINIFLFFKIFIQIINIVMIIRLLIYIDKLKKIKCHCEMAKRQNFIFYWYIVMLSFILLLILILIIILILLLITMSY
jgi:hypothetical protein